MREKLKTFVPEHSDFLEILNDWKLNLAFLMENGRVPDTMKSLARVFAVNYSPRWVRRKEDAHEVLTKQLVSFLRLAGVKVLDSIKLVVDRCAFPVEPTVLTVGLPVNFVMSVKVDEWAVDAISQFRYLKTFPDAFRKVPVIGKPEKAYLVGVNFKSRRGILNEGIHVPYEDWRMQYKKAEASHEGLLEDGELERIMEEDSED